MSNRTLLSLAVFITLTTSALAVPRLFTQDISVADQCRNRMQYELKEHVYQYRATVFGSEQKVGSSGYETRTGGSVDEEITGILEHRERLSSELVEPLVQSYRVLRCRMESVCEVVRGSFQKTGGTVRVSELGCPVIEEPTYSECYAAGDTTDDRAASIDVLELIRECGALVEQTLDTEASALHLAVSYDAGYRSMLQFTGMTDWLSAGLFKDALPTAAGTVNMLGKLHQIPCFIGQCDAVDPSLVPSP